MIKFFRKIRQNLLMENKTGKYFKYAIGEIVLVVIGILIALQINNWNENRQNNRFIKTNLHGVLEELKKDSTMVGRLLNNYEKSNQNRKEFINATNYEQNTREFLEENLENFNKELNLEYSYFKKIRSSGIIEYGIYQDIMKDLIYYYDYMLPYCNKITTTFDAQVIREDEFWRYEQNVYEFNYVADLNSYQNEEVAKNELIKLLKSPKGRNILKIDVRRNNFMIERLSRLKTNLGEMILDLENILNEK
tara:strand:+ start:341 stop:1087 length:747 start_codon:yes stop_codon:yes gene_type:complete